MNEVQKLIFKYRDDLWEKFGSKVDEGRWDYIINLCEDLVGGLIPELSVLGITDDDDYGAICCTLEEILISLMYGHGAIGDLTEEECEAARKAGQ